jgi:WXG100 family type VII secretion target
MTEIGLEGSDVVGDHARRVEEVNSEVRAQLKQLIDDLEPMEHKFVGAAGKAFQDLKAEYADKQTGLDAVLEKIAAALEAAHGNYQTGEEEGAQEHQKVRAQTQDIANRINPQL